MRRRRAMVVGAAALALLASGCGDGSGGEAAAVPSLQPMREIATEISEELLGPLEGLGPCGDPPEATATVDSVPGLTVPDGARLTAVTETGPLTQVEGWVALTPIGVRADMVRRGDVQVLNVEDEVWESESLVSNGDFRTFLKAQGICRTESVFVALVTAEDGSDPSGFGS